MLVKRKKKKKKGRGRKGNKKIYFSGGMRYFFSESSGPLKPLLRSKRVR